MNENDQLWKDIAAPLKPEQIKSRTQRYKDKKTGEFREFTIRYIEARDVIARLNAVAPGNWHRSHTIHQTGGEWVVECHLTIAGVTRSDVGMAPTGTIGGASKAAFSDALKRAAVNFGFGMELYGDFEGMAADDAQTVSDEPFSPPVGGQAGHWIDRDDARKRFWRWVREDKGLEDSNVYEALGVASIHDYAGTMTQAKEQIEAYVDEMLGNASEDDGEYPF